MDQLKQAIYSSKEFAYNNWKYGVALALGSTTALILSYSFAKNLSGLTNFQFMTKIVMKSQQNEFRDVENYDAIPNVTIRPSNELIAWDSLSRKQPKGPIKDVDKWIKQLQDGMKLFVDALQVIPSFSNKPVKHVINKEINGYELTYPGASKQNGVIIYIHGGAFIGGYCENGYPMLCILMQYLGYTSFSIDYRVCPNVSIPQSVNDCIEGYKYVINNFKVEPKNIILIGESAGASLILLMLQKLVKNKNKYQLDLPKCAICISALTDLELNKLPAITENENADCMSNVYGLRECCKKGLEKGDNNLMDPKYSALYGEWKGLCPLYFSCGATEILYSDSQKCVEKCQENGIQVSYEYHESLPHGCGAWCAWLPEARDSIIRIVHWIKKLQNSQ